MYAVIAQTMEDIKVEHERVTRRDDTRPKPNLVAVHRMELPRRWFIAMFEKPDKFALRREPLRDVPAQFALVTDASPRGVGASADLGAFRRPHTLTERTESWPQWKPWRSRSNGSTPNGWAYRGMIQRDRELWRPGPF